MPSNAFLKALFYILFVTVLLASEGTMNTVAIQIHTVCFVDGVKYCPNNIIRCRVFCHTKGFELGGHCTTKGCCCDMIPPASKPPLT
ncbi:uncharacterized protein DS421_12g379280 [Arachis hypogaea]|nr:uncharacterized protein DS421_12g379280 [Arachis hypogaea]